jgi:hypothetical protein
MGRNTSDFIVMRNSERGARFNGHIEEGKWKHYGEEHALLVTTRKYNR